MTKTEKTAEQAAGKELWADRTAGRRDAKERRDSRHSMSGALALGGSWRYREIRLEQNLASHFPTYV